MCEISLSYGQRCIIDNSIKKTGRCGYQAYEVRQQLIKLWIPARFKFDPLADRSRTLQQLILSHV
jgi:hypothetical protein